MSIKKQELIKYRLEKSQVSYEEGIRLLEFGFGNGAANRLYYSSFYMLTGLLLIDNISIKTHSGVKTEFYKLYIKKTG